MTSPTPGLVYAQTKIKSPQVNPALFNQWYNTEHIPDLLKIPGIQSASRYVPCNEDGTFLALYPISDIEIAHRGDLAKVRTTSDVLGGIPYFGVADFDIRYFEVQEIFNPGDWKFDPPSEIILALQYLNSSPSPCSSNFTIRRLSKVSGYTRSVVLKDVGRKGVALEPELTDKGFLVVHVFGKEGEREREEIEKVIGVDAKTTEGKTWRLSVCFP